MENNARKEVGMQINLQQTHSENTFIRYFKSAYKSYTRET